MLDLRAEVRQSRGEVKPRNVCGRCQKTTCRRIEETLWSMHEADIGDYFESQEVDGKVIERPKRLADLPAEIRKNIEKITTNGRGRTVLQLSSKLQASQLKNTRH